MFEPSTRVIAISFGASLAPILVAFFASGRLCAAGRRRDPSVRLPSHALLTVGFFLGGLGGALFGLVVGPSITLDPFLAATVAGPLVEEVGKALLPLALYAAGRLPNRAAGLAVGLVVGAGFASVENWLFAIESYASGGEEEWMTTVQVRLAFGTLIHMGASGLLGAALGESWRSERGWGRMGAPLAGCLAAFAVHGGWNASLVLATQTLAWAIVAAVVALTTAVAIGVLYVDGTRRLPYEQGRLRTGAGART